jgi:hypothetical protein
MDESLLKETDQGVYGLAAVVADFDEADLATLRRIAAVIRTQPRDDVVSAIALAGSAAQSRFQLFPGDCDFFDRVHIKASTRDEAVGRLVEVMIATVAHAFPDPDLQFSEMKLGRYPADARKGEDIVRAGSPVAWSLVELDARVMTVETDDGEPHLVVMREVATDPGFVKLDWVFADPKKHKLVAVSKVIDATWEGPEGAIVALDGVLDSFYQEVYLDPESKGAVERLLDQVKPDGLAAYVEQLEGEIKKYTSPGHENYGKVAKRLYNIFRITNRPEPAGFLRGLFDDPPARLYQMDSAAHALEQALGPQPLPGDGVQGHIDNLVDTLRDCYTGDDLDALVALLKTVPSLDEDARSAALDHINDRATAQVSAYFAEHIRRDPEIVGFLDELGVAH